MPPKKQSQPVAGQWPPPNHPLFERRFDSYHDLFTTLKSLGDLSGYGIVKTRASNPLKGFPEGYTRFDLACVVGKERNSKSEGVRKTSTKKQGCTWSASAVAALENKRKWTLRLATGYEKHNHEPADDAEAIPNAKKLGPEQKAFVSQFADQQGVSNRQIATQLRERFPEVPFARRDLENTRAKIRKDNLDGYTPFQAAMKYLDEQGVHYEVKWARSSANDPEGQVPLALFWSKPWCEKVWKEYPWVQLFDNTYKTNDKGWAFSQIVTMTNLDQAVSCAFAVINTERQEGYDFVVDQHNSLRERIRAPPPAVVLTDYEKAMKNALKRVYPDSHQQLCIFHINKNVKLNTSKKWDKKESDRVNELLLAKGVVPVPPGPNDVVLEDDDDSIPIVDRSARPADPEAHLAEVSGPVSKEVPYTRTGFYKLWEHVLYADTENHFLLAYNKMKEAFSGQKDLLHYIENTYMDIKTEWATYLTRNNRNFGCRTTSCVESVNRLLKSYLVRGNNSMIACVKQSFIMASDMERAFKERKNHQKNRVRREFANKEWLGEAKTKVCWKAQNIMAKAYRKATPYFTTPRNPQGTPYNNCTHHTFLQMGMPCVCELVDRQHAGALKLMKEDFHPF